MKVLLTRDVPKLGRDGEVVTVANGYARNYLFPRQLAVLAHGPALKQHRLRVSREEARATAALEDANKTANLINGREIRIVVRANPKTGRLFGAVTEANAAEALQRDTGAAVDKRRISLIDPIKSTGRYELSVRLAADVSATFTLDVTTEEELADRQAQEAAEARRRELDEVKRASDSAPPEA